MQWTGQLDRFSNGCGRVMVMWVLSVGFVCVVAHWHSAQLVLVIDNDIKFFHNHTSNTALLVGNTFFMVCELLSTPIPM